MFCTTKYLCSPDVSWRPPYPTRALQNQLQPLPTDSMIHESQSPSLELFLMPGDLQFSGPGHPLKFCHPRWVWRRAASTSPESLSEMWTHPPIKIIKYFLRKEKKCGLSPSPNASFCWIRRSPGALRAWYSLRSTAVWEEKGP